MFVQEPVQAAIWHCLNHYDYSDAIFLSERLYAEVKTDDNLFLLATAYYRNGQIDHAYNILQDKMGSTKQCKYLLSKCAYEMQKYSEAEIALSESLYFTRNSNNIDDLVNEYEDQAAFVLLLLAKISTKTGRADQALACYKRALKLNPFLWSSFESMCDMGEHPNPNTYFQLSDLENLNHCHGNGLSNIDAVIIEGNYVESECSSVVGTPQQILTAYTPMNNNSNNSGSVNNSSKGFARDDSPLVCPVSYCLSGISLLNTRSKSMRMKMMDNLNAGSAENSPTFGHILDYAEEYASTPNVAQENEQKSFTKKMRAHMGNLISRKEALMQNSKPVFSQTSVNNSMTPNMPASVPAGQNVRRSSRLFSNSNSVKENNKSPNRNKFVTPKSPSKKTKQRLAKCSLNDFNSYLDNKSRLKKERAETVTSNVSVDEGRSTAGEGVQLQKQSAEGLMCLLREIGSAYSNLARFNCKAAIEEFQQLPPHQFETSWIYCMLGLAYFEIADYENCVKYFSEVHSWEPFRIKYMDIYSTALWHLQKEVALSALAQDLVLSNKNSPITWIVNGNCFSLHKEHDTAIRFLQRAVQVDPNFPYAYTLLGHEYINTEELDKAMSCYRNAIRLDERHYTAWFGIGTIYAKQERFQLALMNYNRALSINPHNSVILCHIGVVQQALKKTDKALSTFNSAIVKDPKNVLCKFHRASLYFTVCRHSEALKELEELKQIIPKESLVYYLIGKVHKKLGNTDLALMHFSWATDLDPKGASSQIKEAFEPAVGRGSDDDSVATPERSGAYLQPVVLFPQDDSDDSL